MPDATLAPALDQAFKILKIDNEKLKEAFKNLYGYTIQKEEYDMAQLLYQIQELKMLDS
ncbi:MAG: hypothetical protein KatS3mg003_2339 [Candidatus Nitrosocaldaceae archaeon]|nr:MAG: hypothetical protein KatS3mg003_2339 [Candidatus Nitrosocaldaceae archaeon]